MKRLLVLTAASLLTALVALPLLDPAGVLAGDGHSHAVRAWMVADALRHGALPTWHNGWYDGFPLLRIGGPLVPSLGALLGALRAGGWPDGAQAAAGASMAAWLALVAGALAGGVAGARRLGTAGGALAALIYGLAPLHLGLVLQAGMLPQAVVQAIAPLAFLSRGRGRASLLILAVLAHPQAGLLLAGLVAVWSLLEGEGVKQILGWSLLLAAGTAWLLLPILLQRDLLPLGVSLSFEPARIERLLRPGRSEWAVRYLGLSVALLALRGLFERGRPGRVEGGTLLVGLGLLLVQPRVAPLLLWPATALAARGGAALWRQARRPLLTAVGLVLVLGTDLLGGDGRADFRPLDSVVTRGTLPGQRVLVREVGRAGFWRSLDALDTGRSTPLGGLPQAATSVMAATLAARGDDALRLLGVDVVVEGGLAHRVPGAGRVSLSGAFTVLPALPAGDWRALRDGDGLPDLEPLVRAAGLSPDAPWAASIPLTRAPGGVGGATGGRVLDVTESPTSLSARVRLDGSGWARLAMTWFPGHRATVDGQPAPLLRTPMGLCAVPVPSGEHLLTVRAGLPTWQWALLVLGALTLLGAGWAGRPRSAARLPARSGRGLRARGDGDDSVRGDSEAAGPRSGGPSRAG